jgi:hypothetical protein
VSAQLPASVPRNEGVPKRRYSVLVHFFYCQGELDIVSFLSMTHQLAPNVPNYSLANHETEGLLVSYCMPITGNQQQLGQENLGTVEVALKCE